MDRNHMLNMIAVLFGGRIAEEIFMHQMTTGASNDFERATEIARDMVMRYGMSDLMGPMVYAENEGEIFLGRSVTRTVNMSEETMQKVDAEIRRIIDGQYAVARKLLEDNRDKVEAMAKALLEWETIDAEQIDDIMAGKPPRPPKPAPAPRRTRPAARPRARAPRRRRTRRSAAPPPRKGAPRGAPFSERGVGAAARGRCGDAFAATCTAALTTSVRRLVAGRHVLDLARPRVMGILNVTPDSFSDGGRFLDRDRAIAHARAMLADGADLVDVGGESTRPGAAPVGEAEEIERVVPVIEALARDGALVSVDTMKPAVMRAAIAAGASMVNDVRALREPGAIEAVAQGGAAVCLMHMRGTPATMQEAPEYVDVVADVRGFLMSRAGACEAAGIARDRIVLDPGFGFGKTLAHNLALLARLRRHRRAGLSGARRAVAQVDARRDHRPGRGRARRGERGGRADRRRARRVDPARARRARDRRCAEGPRRRRSRGRRVATKAGSRSTWMTRGA